MTRMFHDPSVSLALLAGTAIAGDEALKALTPGGLRSAVRAASAAAATAGLVRAATLGGESPGARDTVALLAPLAGTLTVPAVLELDGVLAATGLGGRSALRAAVLIGAAGAAGTGVTLASRGDRSYAAAVAWGLAGAGLAALREKQRAAVMVAAVGLAAVGIATWIGARRR